MKELIKRWTNNSFSLCLYDVNRRDERGKHVLAYRFSDHGRVIFSGEDFACSPCHAIDSMDTVYSLLSFLALREGDTDDEYFSNYTPEQFTWRDSGRAEELSMIVMEGEERLSQKARR